MKKKIQNWGPVLLSTMAGIVAMVGIARCGSSSNGPTFVQIERLARPAVNEGLVTQNALLNAFNSVPPTADLSAAAQPVIANVAQTLTAVYAGVCYVAGAILGMANPATALKPAGLQCKDANGNSLLGANVFDGSGHLSAAFLAAANVYVGTVAGGFVPDVMRIDTTTASGYAAATCNAAGKPTMLCGGRKLDDDTIDITYGYLMNGDPTFSVGPLTNGVTYAGTNDDQGHQAVMATFPYVPGPN
jgi:hypothetical protein